MRPNIWQLLIVLFAILLLFGWKRLPDLARSVGQSLRIFKSEVEQLSDKDDSKKSRPSAASQDTIPGRASDDPVARPSGATTPETPADPAPVHERPDEHGRS